MPNKRKIRIAATQSGSHNLFLFARSFHKAARALAASFHAAGNEFAEFDAAAVVFLYRHAVELSLKSIVLGEGSNALEERPDHISVSKSHAVSWLAQLVAQIVTAMSWQSRFRCEGIESLADFKALVDEINSTDPGLFYFRYPVDPRSQSGVIDFARRLDALIALLESTDRALAAAGDLWTYDAKRKIGDDFGPPIQ